MSTEYTTHSGIEIKVNMVPHYFIEMLSMQIPEPEMPTYYNEQKGEHQPNPFDPGYQKALQEVENLRAVRTYDALLHFGVELINHEIPSKEEWLPTIQKMDDMVGGDLLKGYDLEKDMHIDIVYKKMLVITTLADRTVVLRNTRVDGAAVREALKKFQDRKNRREG